MGRIDFVDAVWKKEYTYKHLKTLNLQFRESSVASSYDKRRFQNPSWILLIVDRTSMECCTGNFCRTNLCKAVISSFFQFRTHLIACILIEVTLKTYFVASVLLAFSSDLSKTGTTTAPNTLMTLKHLTVRAHHVLEFSRTCRTITPVE